jgi:hypothetical protein
MVRCDWSSDVCSSDRPAEGSAFTFAVVGDPQVTQPRTSGGGKQDPASRWFSSDGTTRRGWAKVVELIAKADVDFIASAGDHVDRQGTPGDACEVEYEYFFEPAALRSIPFAPTMGNHDRHHQFAYHYNLPNTTVADQSSYSKAAGSHQYYYRYKNALFVVLNTSEYLKSVQEAKPYIDAIDALIKKAKSENSDAQWLIVQHHKSTYSAADHLADADIAFYVLAGFNDIMVKNSVDLVLSGHDHSYSRTYLVTEADITKEGKINKNATASDNETITKTSGAGTVFMGVNTAGGLKYYDLLTPSPNFGPGGIYYVPVCDEYPYLVGGGKGWLDAGKGDPSDTENKAYWPWASNVIAQSYIPEYTIIEVNGGTLSVETKTVTGRLVDRYTYKKTRPAI